MGDTMPESFTPWPGSDDGALPRDLDNGFVVDVWFRIGRISVRPKAAGVYTWRHTRGGGDIIGYRLHEGPMPRGPGRPRAAPTPSEGKKT